MESKVDIACYSHECVPTESSSGLIEAAVGQWQSCSVMRDADDFLSRALGRHRDVRENTPSRKTKDEGGSVKRREVGHRVDKTRRFEQGLPSEQSNLRNM